MKYRVTILVSYYNAARFIVHKLDNLARQSIFEDCEIILINGGSQQNEDKYVRRFVRDHPNCMHIIFEERVTLYRAWNEGIRESTAPLICNSNADDVLSPKAVEKLAALLNKDKSAGVVFPNVYATRLPNMKWGTVGGSYITTSPHDVIGPFAMWRRSLHDKYGMFDERLWVIGDAQWWNLLRKNKVKFRKCDDHLVIYLVGNGLERARDEQGRILRVEDAKLLNLPKGLVEGW
jgi:glycosyltransferase involved in cell wall biosynthesis